MGIHHLPERGGLHSTNVVTKKRSHCSPNPTALSIAVVSLSLKTSRHEYLGSIRWLKHVCAVGKRASPRPFTLTARRTDPRPATGARSLPCEQNTRVILIAHTIIKINAPCKNTTADAAATRTGRRAPPPRTTSPTGRPHTARPRTSS